MRLFLVATDFSACARKALEFAAELGPPMDAELLLLHVTQLPLGLLESSEVHTVPSQPPIEAGAMMREASRAELDRYAEQVRQTGVSVRTQVEIGEPVKVILDVASQQGAELIVIGTHGRSGFAQLLLGSVAEKVVRRARCPVLIVPERYPGP